MGESTRLHPGFPNAPEGVKGSRRFRGLRTQVGLLGPALVAAAAYVDPGNVAANTTAGSRYGYLLVWVVVLANAMAAMVQYLSAKLGIVTGRSLPEALGDRLSRGPRLMYWVQAELVVMATDVAEILGGAVALSLLFGVPLPWGGVVTVVVSLLILSVRDRHGEIRFEQVVIGMLGVVAVGFAAGLLVARPDPAAVARGLLPRLAGPESLLLAAAMLGATVMPHAVHAHSALARDRHSAQPASARRRILAATRLDVGTALVLAGLVNLALLLIGAVALGSDAGADTIEGVFAGLWDQVGCAAALCFALGLLFSGWVSTAVGCYAGATVMTGLLRVRVPIIVRRGLTSVPALVLLAVGVDPTRALVLSQVVLSFGIPFTLIPLAWLTSRRMVMGECRNHPGTATIAAAICALIVTLNVALVVLTLRGTSAG